MYSLNISYDKKIIHVTASGSLKREELQELYQRLSEAFGQFQEREASLMVSAEKLDTIPQESIQDFSIIVELCLTCAKKVVEVHARTVIRMQSSRIEQTVKLKMKQMQIEKENQQAGLIENPIKNQRDTNQNVGGNSIMRFRTYSEALAYLRDNG